MKDVMSLYLVMNILLNTKLFGPLERMENYCVRL